MQRYISRIDNQTASVVNSLHSIPILYDMGFDLGHTLFYEDSNYMNTAEQVIGYKNLIPRPYLDKKSKK